MKRRQFLNTSVIAGAAALVTPSTVLANAGGEPAVSANASTVLPRRKHTREWFEARLFKQFQVETPGGVVEAELVAIKDGRVAKGLEHFTTVFRVGHDSDVQGLRTLSHGKDRFALLFDRAHDVGDAKLCQAHFSLLV